MAQGIRKALDKHIQTAEDVLFLGGTPEEQSNWLQGLIIAAGNNHVCPKREIWYLDLENQTTDTKVLNLSALPGTPNFRKNVILGDDETATPTGVYKDIQKCVINYLTWALAQPKPIVAVMMNTLTVVFDSKEVEILFDKCSKKGHVLWVFGQLLSTTMPVTMVLQFDAFFFIGLDRLVDTPSLDAWKKTYLIAPSEYKGYKDKLSKKSKQFVNHIKFYDESFSDYVKTARSVVKTNYDGTYDRYPITMLNTFTKGFSFACLDKKEPESSFSSSVMGFPDGLFPLLALVMASKKSKNDGDGDEGNDNDNDNKSDDEDSGALAELKKFLAERAAAFMASASKMEEDD